MRPGTGFGDILDEQLARLAQGWPLPRSADAPAAFTAPRPAPAFLFGTAVGNGSAVRAAASFAYAAPGPRTSHPRPRRHLSSAQTRALDCLRSLGAPALDESFTEAQLKRAFRSLALSLHPDRHLDASEHERQHLCRCFARACDAYRELCRVFVH